MSKLLNFPMKKIGEGSAEIFIPSEGKISKKLPVFYNLVMKLNRDITILLLKQFPPMNLCDPLAGTGIRAIRFAKELKYKSITANDINKKAVALIKKNMRHNKVKFEIYNKDANLMILESNGFDFIDLDVFGSPNFMLDSSIKKLSRNGILAVTATDTSALAGTYPKACKRKYFATPLKNELKHEIGLRILIRKVQLIGAQYEKALIPIFSYSKEHYMRVFFRCEKGKKKVDEILKKHDFYEKAGPLWLGQLWDKKLAERMYKNNKIDFLKTIKDEAKIDTVGFYDIHKLCKRYKIKQIPNYEDLIKKIKKAGYKVNRTHFEPKGLRCNMSFPKLIRILK